MGSTIRRRHTAGPDKSRVGVGQGETNPPRARDPHDVPVGSAATGLSAGLRKMGDFVEEASID